MSMKDVQTALDAVARPRGYSCKNVSWDDAQRGTVGGGLSSIGGNITDTRLWAKDGRRLYTLRSDNWNEKLGVVSADQVALLVGNHHDSDSARGAVLEPVTLRTFLRRASEFGGYAGVPAGTDLGAALVDDKVSIRFQTVFLPVQDDASQRGALEFCTEAYNYNTHADSDPRNLLLLCTTQGTAVQQDGRGAKKLFHHAHHDGQIHRYWLEAERSEHAVGGAQEETEAERADALDRGKATASVIGVPAMGTRFNVLMTVQVPLEQARIQPRRGMISSAACLKKMKKGAVAETLCYSSMTSCAKPRARCAGRGRGGRGGRGGAFMRPGISNAARVSRGSHVDTWAGLTTQAPKRQAAPCTVTVVMYYTVAGGVPSPEDVRAAIDDLDALYASCNASGRLAEAKFDFMKHELTVHEQSDVSHKVHAEPYKPAPVRVANHNIFPNSHTMPAKTSTRRQDKGFSLTSTDISPRPSKSGLGLVGGVLVIVVNGMPPKRSAAAVRRDAPAAATGSTGLPDGGSVAPVRTASAAASTSGQPARKRVPAVVVDDAFLEEGKAWVRAQRKKLQRAVSPFELLDIISLQLHLRHEAWQAEAQGERAPKHLWSREVGAILGRGTDTCGDAWKAFVTERRLPTSAVSTGPRGFKARRLPRTKKLRVALRNWLYEKEACGERVVAATVTGFLCAQGFLPAYLQHVGGKERLAVQRCVQRLVNDLGLSRSRRSGTIRYREKPHVAPQRDHYMGSMLTVRHQRRIVYLDESFVPHDQGAGSQASEASDLTAEPRASAAKSRRYCLLAAILGPDPAIPEPDRQPIHQPQLLRGALQILEGGKKAAKDYRAIFTPALFADWMDRLLSELASLGVHNAVIVMDSARYHKALPPSTPVQSMKKEELVHACQERGIHASLEETKGAIWARLSAWIQEHVHPIAVTKAEAAGHQVLFLPAHYPDLQPMEAVWSHIKGAVGRSYRPDRSFAEVKDALIQAVNQLDAATISAILTQTNQELDKLHGLLLRVDAVTSVESDSEDDASDSDGDGDNEGDGDGDNEGEGGGVADGNRTGTGDDQDEDSAAGTMATDVGGQGGRDGASGTGQTTLYGHGDRTGHVDVGAHQDARKTNHGNSSQVSSDGQQIAAAHGLGAATSLNAPAAIQQDGSGFACPHAQCAAG
ncbi:uncharacterized protein MONBRDRAFT_31945 [Monosiga brevicollis MX1]|uniref:Tc1-like transposase DDE domain-containing protein n=1 Tax=Monosiga brevicollis TaxID=81824 RepID=A9UWE7_MONBE|nr:uncharacterized protein MONBRDRAFT_31945 [Monosiga brevicollis MX1]EDQ90550.1 predicted protein [Monosiga brevicollis MX1]|eukprot:XP_001744601.1 hypothetical protein [Monosiga brevicollis MX1]